MYSPSYTLNHTALGDSDLITIVVEHHDFGALRSLPVNCSIGIDFSLRRCTHYVIETSGVDSTLSFRERLVRDRALRFGASVISRNPTMLQNITPVLYISMLGSY